jgi:predicted AAA+ superfamily ATPase
VIDAELEDQLGVIGAVSLEGPKACGKTMTASRRARTVHRLLGDANLQSIARAAPGSLLDGDKPVLLDEWQVVPTLWNNVKEAVDAASPAKGQFLLTGSATPEDDINRHTGSGRIITMRMRPMSLFETGHSNGHVSLKGLFDGDVPAAANTTMGILDVLDRIVVGGWPGVLDMSIAQAQKWMRGYVDTIVRKDIQALGTRRDPDNVRRLLTSLGRGNATAITLKSLQADVGGADGPAHKDTVHAYLAALERLFLTENVPAWAPHMRSTTPLRKDVTRHLVDPSLAVAALGQGPLQLLHDLHAAGFQFESMVVRDLRIYSQALGGSVHHWRDHNDHEVDVILTLDDGRWAAMEVKLGSERVDEGADSLVRFRRKVDTSKVGDPEFLAVITGVGPAEKRRDGVLTVPITTLGP